MNRRVRLTARLGVDVCMWFTVQESYVDPPDLRQFKRRKGKAYSLNLEG